MPEEHTGDHRRDDPDGGLFVGVAEQHEQRGDGHDPGGDGLGDQVARDLLLPGHRVRRGVGGAGHDAVVDVGHRGVRRGGVGPDHPVAGDGGAGGIERCLVGTAVVDLGLGVLLGRPDGDVVAGDDAVDRIGRIVEVDDLDGLGRAHHHTRRLEPDLDAVVAEVALVRRRGLGVDVDRVVGAGVHAGLAADAVVVFEVDHAVVGTEQRRGRADLHARRVVAVVAAHDVELAGDVGEVAGLDVLDPGAVDPDGHVVFALARHGAGVTADARVAVEEEAEARHRPSVVDVTYAAIGTNCQ